jgi:hypothetical protein
LAIKTREKVIRQSVAQQHQRNLKSKRKLQDSQVATPKQKKAPTALIDRLTPLSINNKPKTDLRDDSNSQTPS